MAVLKQSWGWIYLTAQWCYSCFHSSMALWYCSWSLSSIVWPWQSEKKNVIHYNHSVCHWDWTSQIPLTSTPEATATEHCTRLVRPEAWFTTPPCEEGGVQAASPSLQVWGGHGSGVHQWNVCLRGQLCTIPDCAVWLNQLGFGCRYAFKDGIPSQGFG